MSAVIVTAEIYIDSLEDFAEKTYTSIRANLQSAFEGANVEPKFRIIRVKTAMEGDYEAFVQDRQK